MKRRSSHEDNQETLREKIIGLGERSIRKSYYPELYRRIEELEAARQELAESQARYRSLVENINDAIFSLNTDGLITYVSPVLRNLTGLAPEAIIGHHFAEFIHSDDLALMLALFQRTVAGQTETAEFRVRDATGGFRYVRMSARPTLDKASIIRVTGILADITERKEAELALKRSYQELEQRVAERTADLERMKNDATLANVQKSWFVAAANHDLRQPLQASLAYLSILSRRPGQEEMEELCEKARHSLKAMSDILDVLLDIAELEHGRVKPNMQDFPLNDVLLRITASNQSQAQAKGLEFSCPPTNLAVRSDAKLLERVLSNFVANAIRYTDMGRIDIHCEQTGDTIRIAVTDTGIGIPTEALETIFEDHVQLGNPARDRRMGLGLGLSIARRIADTLGHRISVQSELGSGSSFSIELPLAHIAAAPSEAGAPVPEPLQEYPVVLLIDDDTDVAEAMQSLLCSYGCEAYMAQNRDAAHAMLKAGLKPGLLLCDYRMAGVNGIDLIRQLREALNTTVPAILMTGDKGLTETGLAHCALLHKPVEIEDLFSAISKVMA